MTSRPLAPVTRCCCISPWRRSWILSARRMVVYLTLRVARRRYLHCYPRSTLAFRLTGTKKSMTCAHFAITTDSDGAILALADGGTKAARFAELPPQLRLLQVQLQLFSALFVRAGNEGDAGKQIRIMSNALAKLGAAAPQANSPKASAEMDKLTRFGSCALGYALISASLCACLRPIRPRKLAASLVAPVTALARALDQVARPAYVAAHEICRRCRAAYCMRGSRKRSHCRCGTRACSSWTRACHLRADRARGCELRGPAVTMPARRCERGGRGQCARGISCAVGAI